MRIVRWAGTSGGGIAASVTVLVASTVGFAAAAAGFAAQEVRTCIGEPATIVADNNGPVVGTDGPDVIVGSAGYDEIDPRGGRDLVCAGGSGDDVTDNDAMRDRIQLGAGTDYFRTGPSAIARVDGGLPHGNAPTEGDLILYGNQTGVTVNLSAHSDSHGNQLYGVENVDGTARRDVITGTSASNWFFRSGGPDVMRGLGGDDLLLLGPSNGRSVEARLIGGPGDDLLDVAAGGRTLMLGGAGDDELRGGSGRDRLNGGRGDDHLNGYRGEDNLRGGRGDDRLDADGGNDAIAGGPGRDLWRNWNPAGVANGQHVTTVRIGAGTVRDRLAGESFHDTLAGIEVYRGNRDIEHVYGSPRRDLVHTNGTEGGYTDLIYGRRGDDRMTAPRHGRINGGSGADYCRAETVLHCEA